jgi:hypothetical protein
MPPQHRQIPVLPVRPRVRPLAGKITRSYPVGRQSFSRSDQAQLLTLTISADEPLPANVQASLVTTLMSKDGKSWTSTPFDRADDRSLICRITPNHPGLHSFRAEFSLDGGSTWQRDNVPDAWILIDPPQVDALRIYTLIPTVSGDIADWKDDLKRISDMGFNAIHLLPITAMDTSQSPYSAKDLFDIDHSYLITGSKQDGLSQLADFIAAAKTLKIRLVFDLVLNHVGVNSRMATTAPDWITPDQNEPDGLKRASYWCSQGWRSWNDLVLINYEHPSEGIRSEIWAYMIDYAVFWAKSPRALNSARKSESFSSVESREWPSRPKPDLRTSSERSTPYSPSIPPSAAAKTAGSSMADIQQSSPRSAVIRILKLRASWSSAISTHPTRNSSLSS